MKILAINCSHNASITFLEDGIIKFFLEEDRLSRVKKDTRITNLCRFVAGSHFDMVTYTHATIPVNQKAFYKNMVETHLKDNNITYDNLIEFDKHHLTHAFAAHYNAGYDESISLVIDNGGLELQVDGKELGEEILTIVKMSKDHPPQQVFKICRNEEGKTFKPRKDMELYSVDTLSPAGMYNLLAKIYKANEAGSIMGLSCYGKDPKSIPDYPFIMEKDIFRSVIPWLYRAISLPDKYIKHDVCRGLQKTSENIVKHYFNKIKKEFPNIPICVSGGFFQNCVANYALLQSGYEFFVDPVAHDGGTSIGLAQHMYYVTTGKKPEPYKNLYLGPTYDFDIEEVKKLTKGNVLQLEYKTITASEVATILAQQKAVAIFQGNCEAGPRALGNRSLLFDPRDPLAKEKVNLIKNREWFRPYAGTILFEHKDQWLNLYNKKHTPFMSYALEVLVNKRKIIPGITHIDNTCRAQTLKKEENINFYELIEEFYKITGVPILLNTSLNQAGQPLIYKLDDALDLMRYTPCDYLYLPEKKTMIYKNIQ
jgi:carbamoyltransferase